MCDGNNPARGITFPKENEGGNGKEADDFYR
jgi:hypothetical protein